MFDFVLPYGLQPARLLCPWGSPGKNTGMGGWALLQEIFLTQGSNLCLLCLPALAGRFFTIAFTNYLIWYRMVCTLWFLSINVITILKNIFFLCTHSPHLWSISLGSCFQIGATPYPHISHEAFAMCGDIKDCHDWVEWRRWVAMASSESEAKDGAKHSTMHRTVSPNNLSSPKCQYCCCWETLQ